MEMAEKQLLEIKNDGYLAKFVNTEILIEALKALEDDTISLDDALKIDDFKKMYRKMVPSIMRYKDLLSLVTQEVKVLKKLKKDIKKADGKRHKYDEYIKHERTKTNTLSAAVTAYVEVMTNFDKDYDALYNDLKTFLVERIPSEEVQ